MSLIRRKKDFLHYTIAHGFFHKLSTSRLGVPVNDDGPTEGLTDMLVHRVSGNDKDKSERYDFPVKVNEMLVEMIGLEIVVEDYIEHPGSFPKFKGLFDGLGAGDFFDDFRGSLTFIVVRSAEDSKLGMAPKEFALREKCECLDFLGIVLLFHIVVVIQIRQAIF